VAIRLDATPEAERQMLDTSAWWRANRPSAANLFDRELEQTLTLRFKRILPTPYLVGLTGP
jgi:hypothetical protein